MAPSPPIRSPSTRTAGAVPATSPRAASPCPSVMRSGTGSPPVPAPRCCSRPWWPPWPAQPGSAGSAGLPIRARWSTRLAPVLALVATSLLAGIVAAMALNIEATKSQYTSPGGPLSAACPQFQTQVGPCVWLALVAVGCRRRRVGAVRVDEGRARRQAPRRGGQLPANARGCPASSAPSAEGRIGAARRRRGRRHGSRSGPSRRSLAAGCLGDLAQRRQGRRTGRCRS